MGYGDVAASCEISTVPVSFPSTAGLIVTDIVQLSPGWRVAQLFAETAKFAGALTSEIVTVPLEGFETVSVRGADVCPTGKSPKSSTLGVTTIPRPRKVVR
jgi:hypothetical protein